jgi:hypothetical protein
LPSRVSSDIGNLVRFATNRLSWYDLAALMISKEGECNGQV